MDSDKHGNHENYLSTVADNANNEGSIHNTMNSQSLTGTGLISSATASPKFQCFVQCEDGLNLYVDLGSSTSDWMRNCSHGFGLLQNLHKDNFRTRPSVEMGANFSPAITQGAYLKRKFDEFNGSVEMGANFSPATTQGAVLKRKFDEFNGSVEMGANFSPATTQGAFLRRKFDEFNGSTKGHESLSNKSSRSCLPVLPQPSIAMEELSVQSGAWDNSAMCEKKQLGKEGIDQSSLTCMPPRESEARNIEMGNHASLSICQRGPDNEVAVHNQGRETQRNLEVHYTLEKTRKEMQCTHLPIENCQNGSQRYISKYNDDYKKKSPIVKNLRFLKTLARGPLVQASAVERRRSTRFVDKSS